MVSSTFVFGLHMHYLKVKCTSCYKNIYLHNLYMCYCTNMLTSLKETSSLVRLYKVLVYVHMALKIISKGIMMLNNDYYSYIHILIMIVIHIFIY